MFTIHIISKEEHAMFCFCATVEDRKQLQRLAERKAEAKYSLGAFLLQMLKIYMFTYMEYQGGKYLFND